MLKKSIALGNETYEVGCLQKSTEGHPPQEINMNSSVDAIGEEEKINTNQHSPPMLKNVAPTKSLQIDDNKLEYHHQ